MLNTSAKKSRHWNAGGNALNVETAGYALLTQIQLGRTGYAGPIVTYLTNQRKGGIGFVSTQVFLNQSKQRIVAVLVTSLLCPIPRLTCLIKQKTVTEK